MLLTITDSTTIANVSSGFFSLGSLADIAQLIIAAANIFLVSNILFYQKNKDKNIDLQTARLNEQSIKLQWFKELIVQPNLKNINIFYAKLHSIENKIINSDTTEEQKQEINNIVKLEASILRKSFVDVLFFIDKKFAEKILTQMDEVVDGITEAIFNDELKLNLPLVYEKHIGSKISYSQNNLIALIYNYKGLSD